MDQNIKNLIQRLGEAIHETVSESENIAGVVRDLREQGFEVLLMLEATIGLNELDEEEPVAPRLLGDGKASDGEGPFTTNDLSFLKSLRISLTDDETPE